MVRANDGESASSAGGRRRGANGRRHQTSSPASWKPSYSWQCKSTALCKALAVRESRLSLAAQALPLRRSEHVRTHRISRARSRHRLPPRCARVQDQLAQSFEDLGGVRGGQQQQGLWKDGEVGKGKRALSGMQLCCALA